MIDIDENEIKKPNLNAYQGLAIDAKIFIEELLSKISSNPVSSDLKSWFDYCKEVKSRFPVYPSLEELKSGSTSFVDPYYFIRVI
jgi:hypothetical protein